MHFRSHAQAHYAQWIRRYLEPGDQPWNGLEESRRPMARHLHPRKRSAPNQQPPTDNHPAATRHLPSPMPHLLLSNF
jgi:hypothetical protein